MTKTISVLGLGYIGLPTATVLAAAGHTVKGFDVNRSILDRLRAGEIHIEEPGLLAATRRALASGRLEPVDVLGPADAHIICVPTPFIPESRKADLSYVEAAAKSLAPVLRRGDLVVLESTVPAGTTANVLAPILETSGLNARRDLHVVHCPETVLPGNTLHEMAANHRVVGGLTPEATAYAAALYATFVRGHIIETDATTAEFVKLAENAYRDVNIAFANEVALIARSLGVDAREVVSIANLHPRVRIHQPGPGVGGHCIPVDPWFLVEAAPWARVLRAAREVNDAMPSHVAGLVEAAVRGVKSPVVALLGVAYKANVDDIRESPGLAIARLLEERVAGLDLRPVDPLVPLDRYPTVPLEAALAGADCIVLATDHDAFRKIDPKQAATAMRARRVVDARGFFDRSAWVAEGFEIDVV